MKLHLLLLPLLGCIAACGPSKAGSGRAQIPDQGPAVFPLASGEAGPDDIGRFLAGLPVGRGAALSRLQQTSEYQMHQREMRSLWRVARVRCNFMQAWSDSQLSPAVGSGTVFYPFGGPDLLYVSAMFPNSRNYVLMGLEPVGDVPALEKQAPGEVLAGLAAFRKAMRAELQTGYFITEDMRADLERGAMRGVTPILLGTVALMGGRVDSANGISAGGKSGVDLRFRDGSGRRHGAFYVSGDLSNSGFDSGYSQWLGGLGGRITYFKAASYLMHDDRFSRSRDFFLSQSSAVLQDDSGIPYRYLGQGWTMRFFGKYERPIELFAKFQQDDLRQAFATNPSGPLNFGTGYDVNQWAGNLMLAIKR